VLALLKLIEDGTGGWGVSMRFFAVPWIAQSNGFLQFLVFAVPFLVLGFLGVFVGMLVKRWGLAGMFTAGLAAMVVLGAVAALLTWLRAWPAIGDWLTGQSAVSLVAGWPMVLAAALAGGGYLAIRRATP